MFKSRKLTWLALPILALILASLACGTGYRTSSSISGLTGKSRIQMNEASGVNTNSLEINEDWSYTGVNATVTFSVTEGSCQATLTGNENTSIIVSAAAGSPGQSTGTLVTDGFGEVDLETNCQDAKELDLLIDFTRK
jgi:hypothetical protein